MDHRQQGGQGNLVGGEGSRVDGVIENPVGGCPPAPAVCFHKTEEVAPKGVVIRAAGHPRNRRHLRPGGTDTAGNLHTGPHPGPGRKNTRVRGQPYTCETGETVPSLIQQRYPLRTGRRPMSSQDTS